MKPRSAGTAVSSVSVTNSSQEFLREFRVEDSYPSKAEDPVFIHLVSALLCHCMRAALNFHTGRKVQLHCVMFLGAVKEQHIFVGIVNSRYCK